MFQQRMNGAGRKSCFSRNVERQLALESLEDRSLLSVSVGLPFGPTANTAPALHGPMLPGGVSASVATQLEMHMPAEVPNGVPMPVELIARDAQNHLVKDYSGTVTLTSTDPKAVLPTTVIFEHGFAHFRVTFNTEGPQSLTATDDSVTPLTVTKDTTVAAPLVATQLVMQMPEKATSGKPVTVRLAAMTADHRLVQNYSGTVTLSSTDAKAVLPKMITFEHGIAVFQVTFGTLGARGLTATDNSATPITVTKTTTVSAPIVATQLRMHLPKDALLGKPVMVELVALDANDRLVKDYSGTITLTSTDLKIQLPKAVTFHHGVAVFQVIFGTVGTESLTATDDSATPLSVTLNTNVVAPPSPKPGPTTRRGK